MSLWQIFMIGIVPLFFLQRGFPWHKLRVTAALMAAAIAGQLATPAVGYPPVLWYLIIDIAAAAVVLTRPAGTAQKAIGVGFVGMILYHIGFAAAVWWYGDNVNSAPYYSFQANVGWLQFGVLAAWGSVDSGGAIYNRFRDWRTGVAFPQAKRAGGA